MRICNTIHTQCSPIRYLPLPTWDLEPPWPRHRLHKVLQCHCRWPPRRPRTLHPATRPLRRRHAWRGAVPHFFFWPIENWWVCHEQICFMASLPWANMFYGEFPWVNLFYGDFAMKNCDSAIVLKVVFFFRIVFLLYLLMFFCNGKTGESNNKELLSHLHMGQPPGDFQDPVYLVGGFNPLTN